MSNQNYIINILNLKENNLIFKKNFYYENKIKGKPIKYLKLFYLIILLAVLNVVFYLMINLKSMDL